MSASRPSIPSMADLWFSEIEQAALAAAEQAGGSPAQFCPLPDSETLPLLYAVLETRLDLLETRLTRLEGGYRKTR